MILTRDYSSTCYGCCKCLRGVTTYSEAQVRRRLVAHGTNTCVISVFTCIGVEASACCAVRYTGSGPKHPTDDVYWHPPLIGSQNQGVGTICLYCLLGPWRVGVKD